MPKGPKGEKRPADVIGAAVTVAKIATGEIEETTDDGKNKAAQELGRKGGKVRAEKMTPKRRVEIANKAAGSVHIGLISLSVRYRRVTFPNQFNDLRPEQTQHGGEPDVDGPGRTRWSTGWCSCVVSTKSSGDIFLAGRRHDCQTAAPKVIRRRRLDGRIGHTALRREADLAARQGPRARDIACHFR
jgi:hypothetical protein